MNRYRPGGPEQIRNKMSTGDPYTLFQNDIMSKEQFFERFHRVILSPEKTLMLAVLEDAIDLLKPIARTLNTRKEVREAIEWFRSRDTSFIYSFEIICESLDIDPDAIRRFLMRRDPRICFSLRLVGKKDGRSIR